ncbi:MAG: NAD(P)H-hydrate dehydratase [Neisseria sp.]|nr:NAD(P)H-hydrate dehydratase [Neisseria sp.]
MNISVDLPAARRRFPALCVPRAPDTNKGSYGTLGIVGGTDGMSGAVVLAAMAALKSGCGKVRVGFHQSILPLPWLPEAPEVMLHTAPELIRQPAIDAWVIGCGLGTDAAAVALVQDLLQTEHHTDVPVLLDADALNIVAQHHMRLPEKRTLILTPHPGEAARLLDGTIGDVQAQRETAAVTLAQRYDAWVVLKGHRSIIAAPNGEVQINDSGNPALATAGSGDVLSGMIGSLLAQGVPVAQAVGGGVWLHGAAADVLAEQGMAVGLCASELANAVRKIRNDLIRGNC